MTDNVKNKLIADQQVEIVELKEEAKLYRGALNLIHSQLVCIGGPLNDNIKGYDKAQMGDMFKIARLIEEVI